MNNLQKPKLYKVRTYPGFERVNGNFYGASFTLSPESLNKTSRKEKI